MWIDARLKAKVMTQREAYDALRTRWPDLFPWGDDSLDSFRAFIRGRTPDAEQEAAFIEVLGGPGPTAETDPEPSDLASAIRGLTEELRLLRESQASTGAATAALVAVAIHETLQAAGLVVEPQRP